MTAALVDSNVLLDIATRDPRWLEASRATLRRCLEQGPLVVNPIVFAEVSVGFLHPREVDAVLPADLFRREPLLWDAAFLAGKAFLAYRRRGGSRTAPLPDFYIGAHALVAGHRLVTRDAERYRTYFPEVELVVPE